jgi:hypothetical protein
LRKPAIFGPEENQPITVCSLGREKGFLPHPY